MAAAALIPYVLTDDGSDVFAAECRFQQVRLEPVDYLKLLHLAGEAKKIDQDAIEWQGRQIARLELGHSDVLDEVGLRVGLGVCRIEAVDVLDQSMVGAAVAFGKQKTTCVSTVRRDAADTRRMFPDGERRVAVADHSRSRLDEERQHVSQNFLRDCHHAVWREQRPEEVGITESVDDAQLR